MIDSGAPRRYKWTMAPMDPYGIELPDVPDARAPGIPVAEPASPLEESHYLVIRQAMLARRPVLRAVRTARFSAVTILVIGIISLPLAMFTPGWDGLLAAVAVCIVGAIEHVGSRRLQQGEPSAASLLGTNQLIFMALIAAYCLIQMLSFSPDETAAALGVKPGMSKRSPASPALDVEEILQVWVPLATYGFYTLVIILSLLFQGGLALYYFTRRPYLEAARRNTPAWVRRLLVELGE